MDFVMITDYTDEAFQSAFQMYFEELGITVKDYEGLFQEMNTEQGNQTLVYKEHGEIIAFLMCRCDELKDWFFRMNTGFVREFWVKKEYRNKGIGTKLLQKAEGYFKLQKCVCVLLTTDTAEDFYLKNGYQKEENIIAKNEDCVFMKQL